MITKLADKWRTTERLADDSDEKFGEYMDGYQCAAELEAALPTWTRITDGAKIDIDRYGLYLITSKRKDGRWRNPQVVTGWVLDVDDYFRPLGDLDFPPEQES